MLPPPVDTNPAYWRRRAEDAVTLAGQMQDDLSKEMMLRVAIEYERIAKGMEIRGGRLSKSARGE
jgi:CRISPR/Cas system-associated protein Csm6